MEPIGDGKRRFTRYWTKFVEGEVDRYIPGTGKRKFKKDSRTWLHKSSKNFKTEVAKDVPPEAKAPPEKAEATDVDKATNEAIEAAPRYDEVSIKDEVKEIYHEPKVPVEETDEDRSVRLCLEDVILSIEADGNKPIADSMAKIEPEVQKAISLPTTGTNAGSQDGPVRGVVLSELCLRAEKLELSNESDPEATNTPTSGSATSTPGSNSSLETTSTRKKVTKKIKKLSICADKKLKSTKTSRKTKLQGKKSVLSKYTVKKARHQSGKSRVRSCTDTSKKKKCEHSALGKATTRVALTKSAVMKRKRNPSKSLLIAKRSKKRQLKRLQAVKKDSTKKSLSKSETSDQNATSLIPGQAAEDKLYRTHRTNSFMADGENPSSKTAVVTQDNLLLAEKLSEGNVLIRKRKNATAICKSTSTSSIQEKRSRGSLVEDVKSILTKRDRKPFGLKCLESDAPSSPGSSRKSYSANSLQVQCSATQGSLDEWESCPSSTVVQQGSDSSFTVSTPRGCLSCPWVNSQDCLEESDSDIFKEYYDADRCVVLAPSPGNHCLATLNTDHLDERLESACEESAHILHRTKALLRQQYLAESWEWVSKSETSLLSDITLNWYQPDTH